MRTEKRTRRMVGCWRSPAWWSLAAVVACCAPALGQLPSLGGVRLPNVGVPSAPRIVPSAAPIAPRALPQPRVQGTVPHVGSAGSSAAPQLLAARPQPATIGSGAPGGHPVNLGISLGTKDNRLCILKVMPSTPGGGAGFRVGDYLLAVDKTWVRSPAELTSQLEAAAKATGQAWVFVERDGKQQWVSLDLVGQATPRLGIQAIETPHGLTIKAMESLSAAAAANLRVGDQIISCNGLPIGTTGDLLTQVQAAVSQTGALELKVLRDGVVQTVDVRTALLASLSADSSQRLQLSIDKICQDLGRMTAAASGDLRAKIAAALQAAENLQVDLQELKDLELDPLLTRIDLCQGQIDVLRIELDKLLLMADGNVRAIIRSCRGKIAGLEANLALLAKAAGHASGTALASVDDLSNDKLVICGKLDALVEKLRAVSVGDDSLLRHRLDDVCLKIERLKQGLNDIDLGSGSSPDCRRFCRDLIAIRLRICDVCVSIGDAKGRDAISALLCELAGIQTKLEALVRGTAEEGKERAHDLLADAADSLEALTDSLEQCLADATGELNEALAEAKDKVRRLESEVKELAGKADDLAEEKLSRLVAEVGALGERLSDLAHDKSEALFERLGDACDKAAALRYCLEELVAAKFDRVADAKEAILAKAENVKEAVGKVVDHTDDKLEGVLAKVSALCDGLPSRLDVVGDGVENKISNLRSRVRELKSELVECTRGLKGDVHDRLCDVRGKLDRLCADLDAYAYTVVYAAADATAEVERLRARIDATAKAIAGQSLQVDP